MKKIGGWKKKTIIVLAVVAIAGVGISISLSKRAEAKTDQGLDEFEIQEVTTRTLTKSVGATGKIISVNKKDVTADVQNVKIEKMSVEVGDRINKGDQIAVLDSSDLRDSLKEAEKSLEITKGQNKISKASAERSVEDAERNAEYSTDTAKRNMDDAYTSYQKAVKELNSKKSDLADYKTKMNSNKSDAKYYSSQIQNKEGKLAELKSEMAVAQQAYEAALSEQKSNKSTEPAIIDSLNNKVETLRAAYNMAVSYYSSASASLVDLQSDYSDANTDYATYKSKYEALDESLSNYEDKVDSTKTAYESAKKAYENAIAVQESSVESAKSSKQSIILSQDTTVIENQVKDYKAKIQDCTLYSPISGIVTAVNYEAGDNYLSGAIITVQDCSEYEVETQIDEYDISDIEIGQTVLIKTNATGEEEMTGKVNFISPVSSNSMNQVAGSTDVSYTVRVSIDNPSERLRLDMSASISIIITEHENAKTVPYNCISIDEEGNSCVTVVRKDSDKGKDNAVTETVKVKIIMESNYYTEIESKELSVGDKIVVTEVLEATSIFDLMADQSGGTF